MDFRRLLGLVAFVPALCGAACSSATEDDAADEGGGGESALVSEEGPVDVPGGPTEVWAVTHKWSDINAATGKTYEESYADWVQGLRRVPGFRYGETLHFA